VVVLQGQRDVETLAEVEGGIVEEKVSGVISTTGTE
jgi:hypothetical protein